ncbi:MULTISPECIES: ATP-grasp domain-containing protein [unclassified Paenibacillus]|uniref:ATP-grasp domain-containing protein n=1 Tax=unclassified Paenibacillus TaxID=185978 RepID=UPI000CFC7757|nr:MULTISPECIES: ATP-grasp domain-containing protein [unclassified Paenibacillus]PRA08797.1 ATP-grasp domain-containing protein [Paenibacillus sp. MYb63]PRA48731.1 ATP-grasp domain-containing protein [Paenibacillus sp. MYb67]
MTTRSGETGHRTAASLRVLLTGGRAPVTLDLARMLHRAGHRVYVAESAVRHLTRSSSAVEQCAVVPSPRHNTRAYLEELERLVQDWQIDLLIPMCEEVFYVAQGADRLRAYCRVLVTTLEQLHALHHKYDFIQLAGSLGLSVPDTRLINSQQEWTEAQSVLGEEGDWVWKPVYSRFAAKVRMPTRLIDDAGAGTEQEGHTSKKKHRHLRNDPPEEGELSSALPWVAQAFIPGQVLCTYSIAHEGQLVAHATYDSRYRTGSVGASVFFEQVEHEGALAWVRQFVQATGFSGQIGFDFIEGQDGQVYAIECNPRATSGIHLFHPGDDLVRALTEPETLVKEGRMITPARGSKAMLMLPMLGSGLQQIFGKGKFRAWVAAWCGARDVVYMRQDIQPLFEQFAVVLTAWRLARSQKFSLTEALTHDIEWNGEQQ